MTQTVKFATFPFTHKGFNFVSRIAETSPQLPMIMMIGEAFIKMNKDAIDELMQLDENSSEEYILSQLAHLNENGTEMFLELAGTN
jgi:hypothetical protein